MVSWIYRVCIRQRHCWTTTEPIWHEPARRVWPITIARHFYHKNECLHRHWACFNFCWSAMVDKEIINGWFFECGCKSEQGSKQNTTRNESRRIRNLMINFTFSSFQPTGTWWRNGNQSASIPPRIRSSDLDLPGSLRVVVQTEGELHSSVSLPVRV